MHTSVEPENFADLASRARLLWVSSGGWDANRVLWFLTGCGDGDLGGKDQWQWHSWKMENKEINLVPAV